MPPNLPPWKIRMVHDMIASKSLTVEEMAYEAECSERAIIDIGKYLRVLAEADDTSAVQRCPIIIVNIFQAQNYGSPLTIPISTTSKAPGVHMNAGTNEAIQKQT
ncbi:hypothetical protein N7476_004986 [Penicillium atrosanguineum]|uniref:Uncharacterized protein n=1 Tax=Penicillium atrosanguineum TaxID=1132637 RepID=A0A9W9U633_9EURO|nr:hypothetical protein N7476_004986 [Penicillium atrosanguineum]